MPYNKYHYIQAHKILKKLITRKNWKYNLISKLCEICSEGQKMGYIAPPKSQ